MTGMAFYTSTNSWRWRSGKLVPGGDAKWVFIPEAKRFAQRWPGTKLVSINCQRTRGPREYLRYVKVLDRLDWYAPSKLLSSTLDDVSFYGHGWPTKMQHGMDTGNLYRLARSLANVLVRNGQVFFNCCSMARGPYMTKSGRYNGETGWLYNRCFGSFVCKLYRELCSNGRPDIRVYGHYTSGHATRNPYVVEAKGGLRHSVLVPNVSWVVPPASRWDKSLYKKVGLLDEWYANRPEWLAWIDFLKTNDLKTAVKKFGAE